MATRMEQAVGPYLGFAAFDLELSISNVQTAHVPGLGMDVTDSDPATTDSCKASGVVVVSASNSGQ